MAVEIVVAVLLLVLGVAFLLRWGASAAKVLPPGWTNPPADTRTGDLSVAVSSGSLHQFLLRQHDGGHRPVYSFWWRNKRVVTTCAVETFKTTENLFHRPKLIFAQCFEPLHGSCSIQSINGTEWKERKKLLHGTIRGNNLGSFFSDFVCIAQEAEERWALPDRPIRLMQEMFRMTLKAILYAVLGNIFEEDSEIESLANAYHLCKCEMDKRILEVPLKTSQRELDFQSNLKRLNGTLMRMIKARKERKNCKRLPFMDTLLASRASEEQVLSDTVTFMGGFHTAGYYMTWMFYFLVQHPDIQERLHKEIKERVGGECGKKLKLYTLTSNSFLRQVLDEASRLSTTAPFSAHQSDQDMVVDGYRGWVPCTC